MAEAERKQGGQFISKVKVEGSMFIIFLLNQGKLNLKQDTHTLAKV